MAYIRKPYAEYWKAANGLWYFHRVASNGKITDPSQGYKGVSASNVRRAIQRRWSGIKMERIPA